MVICYTVNMFDPSWATILSDLFINLSAGWFGVVLIVPNFTEEKGAKKWWTLAFDLLAAVLCLLFAFSLRKSL